jgi:NAD(P)-dependent dehydrogenase (short-subunit alcohol dehydrogenase family)
MASVLITGANRGLGLEFARQYAAAGWRVFACCRNPGEAPALHELSRTAPAGVRVHALDVVDFARIEELARELRDEPLDVLLNNAGVYGPSKMVLGRIDYRAWADVFAVNTMAPLKMAECFADNVARSGRKVLACLSSQLGSIAGNTSGRHYLYRSTKAALNSVVRSLAVDLRPRGVIAVALHPGWVQTDMGGADADLRPADSARAVIEVLARLRPEDSGKFLSYTGAELPW